MIILKSLEVREENRCFQLFSSSERSKSRKPRLFALSSSDNASILVQLDAPQLGLTGFYKFVMFILKSLEVISGNRLLPSVMGLMVSTHLFPLLFPRLLSTNLTNP